MSPVVSLALCHCKITVTKGKELLHLSALSSAVWGFGPYIHVNPSHTLVAASQLHLIPTQNFYFSAFHT